MVTNRDLENALGNACRKPAGKGSKFLALLSGYEDIECGKDTIRLHSGQIDFSPAAGAWPLAFPIYAIRKAGWESGVEITTAEIYGDELPGYYFGSGRFEKYVKEAAASRDMEVVDLLDSRININHSDSAYSIRMSLVVETPQNVKKALEDMRKFYGFLKEKYEESLPGYAISLHS